MAPSYSLSYQKLWLLFLAAAHLFSSLSSTSSVDQLLSGTISIAALCHALVLVAAPLCLLAKQFRVPLFMMIAGYLGTTLIVLPTSPNHRILISLIDLGVLLDLARRSPQVPSRSTITMTRALVVILYFFSGFAKLNSDFMSPASCADQFLYHISSSLSFLMGFSPFDHIPRAAIRWGATVLELSLPLLLLQPRTRKWGIVCAMIFHLGLAFDPIKRFFNFSSVMYLGLLSFLDPSEREIQLPRILKGAFISAPLLFLLCSLVLPITLDSSPSLRLAQFQVGVLFWMLAYVPLAIFLIRNQVLSTGQDVPGSIHRAHAMIVLLAVLNGLSPYVGLKTGSSFTMYSNLAMTANGSNHLIVPRSLDLLGLQQTRVTIVQSSNHELMKVLHRDGELALYPFELYRVLTKHPTDFIEYRDDSGRLITAGGAYPLPPPPDYFWLRKLIVFHPPSNMHRQCAW